MTDFKIFSIQNWSNKISYLHFNPSKPNNSLTRLPSLKKNNHGGALGWK